MKPTPCGVIYRPYRHGRQERLGIALPVMVTLEETPRLVSETGLWDTVGEELSGHVLDASLPKRHAEYLVCARAYGRYRDMAGATRVEANVAGKRKALVVTGARHWEGDQPSSPQSFDELSIDWPLAFGGAGYAPNPAGRGYLAPGGAPCPPLPQDVSQLPCVEYPHDRLIARGEAIAPASYTPVDASWPQRGALYGTLDQRWMNEEFPGFPSTMDPHYFNAAPVDQQFPEWSAMPAATAYEFVHLHPSQPRLYGNLPALHGRCFVQRHADELVEVPTRLTTVWFIPHRERAIMIFHGDCAIDEFDADDVRCLMLGLEYDGEARPREHYERVFALRMDSKRGALHALRDADLVPRGLLASYASPFGPSTQAQRPPRHHMQQRVQQKVQRIVAAAGIHTPAAATYVPTNEDGPAIDSLADYVEQMERSAVAQRAALEAKRQEMEQLRCTLGPGANSAQERMPSGPPRPLQFVDPPAAANGSASHHSTKPAASARDDALEKLREAYRHTVQHRGAAPALDANASEALRAHIAALQGRGESLAGLDLTGADLRGMNLRDACLTGALLEGADLRDVDLTGAALQRAVLARANLERTVFDGADLGGANLSLATCSSTRFRAALLDACVFERVAFERCDFASASIHTAHFHQCRFHEADFSRAKLGNLVWIDQSFEAVCFRDATIRKLTFLQCRMTSADFSGADIAGLAFLDSDATGSRFARSTIRKAALSQGVILDDADFSDAQLIEVTLQGARAARASFERATLRQSDFSDAAMGGARMRNLKADDTQFVRTDFRGADLSRADLIGAYLRGADLRGARLDEANLFRANLSEAHTDDHTSMQDAYQLRTVLHPKRAAA